MFPPAFYVVAGAICVVVAIAGAVILTPIVTWLTQSPSLQDQSQSIRSVGGGRVYVELSAFGQDEEGYFIPGYGRLLRDTDADPLRQMTEVQRWKGKVAFICYDKTAPGSDVKEYVIGEIVPL